MIELNDSENIKDDILNTAIRCFNCNFVLVMPIKIYNAWICNKRPFWDYAINILRS